MGWWRNPDGTILGDGPADVLDDALQSLHSGTTRVTLGDVLGGIGTLLRTHHGPFATGTEASFRLVANSAGTRIVESAPPDGRALGVLADALESVAEDYQSSEMGRLPTVDEVVATLDFILGSEPERLFDELTSPVSVRVQRTSYEQ